MVFFSYPWQRVMKRSCKRRGGPGRLHRQSVAHRSRRRSIRLAAPAEIKLKPSLSSGKTATSSSSWRAGYAASKAFDNDPATRWAGAAGTRSGWLEVDLGKVKTVGRVAIAELEFPSGQEFTVEYQYGSWQEVARGTTIDGMKKFTFPPVQTQCVRLNILRTEAANYPVPTISEMQVFEK